MLDDFKKPVLFQDVEFRSEDDCYYLFHQSENKILKLENSIATNIIIQINGSNRIRDIIDNIQSEYSETSPIIIEEDLSEFFKFLNDENFIVFFE